MIGKTISHYRIVEELGRGGMGIVYRAEDTKLGRDVALKFLPPEFSRDEEAGERFIREARAAAALNHPNICTIHEIGEHDGRSFIVMEHIEGRSLREMITGGPLPLDRAVDIAMQTAAGLAEAHGKNVVHRDIKPANIMITSGGRVKITDFGMALLHGGTLLTKEGTTLGTVSYMSPEQAHGGELDRRTDLWSLGVMLYEMVSGRRPFRGDYDQAVIYSILNDGIEPLTALRTGVPPELDRITEKCLTRDIDERYQTAGGLIADLRHLKRTMEPGKAADAGSVSPRRRLRWLALIAPVALVAVLAAVYFSGALRHERGSGAGTTGDDGNTMIVVLPFENLGPPEEAYFADGITDAITARLAGLSGLGVISRQSAVQYRGSGKTSRQIGEELGVDYILEGTVQRERPGDSHSRVRIIPQLIRCSDDIHLWAGTYDGEMTEVFSLQSQIAEQVAGELDVKLLGGERTSLESRPTANLDAYDYYLKSLEYKAMWSEPENNRKCIGLLKKALEADPQFALAWTDLSTVYVWTYWTSQDEEGLVKAQSAVDRAIAIDRDLPEVELTLGFIQYYGYRDYDEAAEHFEAALARRPNYSEAFIGLGLIRRRQGRWEESLEHFERAARINPRDTRLYFDGVGYDLAVMHRFDEAERLLDRAIDMEPTVTISYFLKSSIILNRDGDVEEAKKNLDRMFSIVSPEDMCFVFQYVETGPISRICYGSTCGFLDRLEPENCPAMSDWEKMYRRIMIYLCTEDRDAGREALHFADSIRSVLPGGFPAALLTQQGRVYIVLGKLYAKYGRREDAIREAHRAEEAIPISEDAVDGPDILCEVIDILVMTGEYEAAFDRLDHLMSVPCNYTMRLFELDPLYEPLRDMPRYRELLEKYPAP